jgi:hypothetical protein
VIDNDELAKILHINADGDLPGLLRRRQAALYRVDGRRGRCAARLEEICAEVDGSSPGSKRFIVLSDRDSDADLAPIPSLLLTSAVHHHLIRGEDPHPGRAHRRGRRRARGAPRRAAHRLRRGGGQPLPGDGDRRGPRRAGGHHRRHPREGRAQPHQGARQGRAQGDEQDGHLDRRVLPRRPDLRGDRPVPGARRPLLHRHHLRLGGVGLDVIAEEVARHARPTRRAASRRRTARSRSAASTSGAARASRTCSTPRRSSASSTPRAPGATTSSSSTPRGSTSSPSG